MFDMQYSQNGVPLSSQNPLQLQGSTSQQQGGYYQPMTPVQGIYDPSQSTLFPLWAGYEPQYSQPWEPTPFAPIPNPQQPSSGGYPTAGSVPVSGSPGGFGSSSGSYTFNSNTPNYTTNNQGQIATQLPSSTTQANIGQTGAAVPIGWRVNPVTGAPEQWNGTQYVGVTMPTTQTNLPDNPNPSSNVAHYDQYGADGQIYTYDYATQRYVVKTTPSGGTVQTPPTGEQPVTQGGSIEPAMKGAMLQALQGLSGGAKIPEMNWALPDPVNFSQPSPVQAQNLQGPGYTPVDIGGYGDGGGFDVQANLINGPRGPESPMLQGNVSQSGGQSPAQGQAQQPPQAPNLQDLMPAGRGINVGQGSPQGVPPPPMPPMPQSFNGGPSGAPSDQSEEAFNAAEIASSPYSQMPRKKTRFVPAGSPLNIRGQDYPLDQLSAEGPKPSNVGTDATKQPDVFGDFLKDPAKSASGMWNYLNAPPEERAKMEAPPQEKPTRDLSFKDLRDYGKAANKLKQMKETKNASKPQEQAPSSVVNPDDYSTPPIQRPEESLFSKPTEAPAKTSAPKSDWSEQDELDYEQYVANRRRPEQKAPPEDLRIKRETTYQRQAELAQGRGEYRESENRDSIRKQNFEQAKANSEPLREAIATHIRINEMAKSHPNVPMKHYAPAIAKAQEKLEAAAKEFAPYATALYDSYGTSSELGKEAVDAAINGLTIEQQRKKDAAAKGLEAVPDNFAPGGGVFTPRQMVDGQGRPLSKGERFRAEVNKGTLYGGGLIQTGLKALAGKLGPMNQLPNPRDPLVQKYEGDKQKAADAHMAYMKEQETALTANDKLDDEQTRNVIADDQNAFTESENTTEKSETRFDKDRDRTVAMNQDIYGAQKDLRTAKQFDRKQDLAESKEDRAATQQQANLQFKLSAQQEKQREFDYSQARQDARFMMAHNQRAAQADARLNQDLAQFRANLEQRGGRIEKIAEIGRKRNEIAMKRYELANKLGDKTIELKERLMLWHMIGAADRTIQVLTRAGEAIMQFVRP